MLHNTILSRRAQWLRGRVSDSYADPLHSMNSEVNWYNYTFQCHSIPSFRESAAQQSLVCEDAPEGNTVYQLKIL